MTVVTPRFQTQLMCIRHINCFFPSGEEYNSTAWSHCKGFCSEKTGPNGSFFGIFYYNTRAGGLNSQFCPGVEAGFFKQILHMILYGFS